MRYSNGDLYEGTWLNGQQEGRGMFTYADGRIYDGIWRKARMDGEGLLTLQNGTSYKGRFKKDKLHGTCIVMVPGEPERLYFEYKNGKEVRQLTLHEFQHLNTYKET